MSDISDQRRYYERMMDEIAAEHQKQLDQLRTENAELLEQLKYERQTSRSRLESIDILKAENAKLRKLAAILCHCMQIKALCDDCCIDGHKGELARDPLCACDGLHRMLRELGVEVNE